MSIPNKSKIPLRGIGKLFTHLPAGVRAKLESAFVEAEDQINYHNRSVIDDQERRILSSYVSAPVAVLTQNSRGFDVTWERLEDRHLSFYEAQVALTSNFADPTTYKLAETSLAVEGVGTTVYIRVRGVRWDGNTGNWSNTVSMSSITSGPVTYSRGLDDVEPFYIIQPGFPYPKPLQRLVITPQRQNGGIVVFGSIATENIGATGNPTVIVTLNGVTVSQISNAEYFGTSGPFDGTGCGFGPVFVGHDQFYFGDQVSQLATIRTSTGSHSSSGTHTGWTSANPTVYRVVFGASGSPSAASTKNVEFTGYGFGVPSGNTITGIQVTYTATDNNYSTGIYDPADIVTLSLLDGGVVRSNNKATGSPEWGNSAKSWGGRSDLWGEVAGYWTPSKINASNFGILMRGRVYALAAGGTRIISTTWPTITVYSTNATTGNVDIQIRFQAGPFDTNGLLACTLNAIEFGGAL